MYCIDPVVIHIRNYVSFNYFEVSEFGIEPTDISVLWLFTIHMIKDVPIKMDHNFAVVCTVFEIAEQKEQAHLSHCIWTINESRVLHHVVYWVLSYVLEGHVGSIFTVKWYKHPEDHCLSDNHFQIWNLTISFLCSCI